MDPVVILDLPRLVDLSIGIPNVGNINSTFLHTLLHVIVRKLGMEDYRVELSAGSGSVQVKELLPYVEKGSLILTEYKIKPNKEREVVPVLKSGEVKNVFVVEKKGSETRRDETKRRDNASGARRKEDKSGAIPKTMTDSQLRAIEVAEQQKIKEYQKWGVHNVERQSFSRRSKSAEREDIRKIDEAVCEINAAISDMLPQVIESELSKYKDLKSRLDALERQVKSLSKHVNHTESASECVSTTRRSVFLKSQTPGTKSAPGFIAKEQIDLLMEGILKDKDGKLMSKIEDKIKNTLIKDMQAQLMRDLIERLKGECCKTSNDIVNTRIQQIESDFLKAMKDLEDMLNKCQGDELKHLLDSHMSQVMERLSKVERRSRSLTTVSTACTFCPDTKCTACCSVTAQSGRTTPDLPTRSSTPKRPHTSQSLKSSDEKIPLPRKLTKKSKSDIEFKPSFRSKSYIDDSFHSSKKEFDPEKPIPPAKKGRPSGGYYTTSRTEDRSFREKYNNTQFPQESECSYCLDLEKNEQKTKGRRLSCGCICTCQGCQQSNYKDCSQQKH